MRRTPVILMAVVAAVGLVVVGCSGGPPAATPTKAPLTSSPSATAPATSAKAAEPTKAPGAPAKKVDYPLKGKSLTVIVPWEAGGITDIAARVLSAALEKELGIPTQVVNKPGAASQVGITELARSKPDGYTIGYTNLPGTLTTYLDPERKAIYTRKDFEPVAVHAWSPGTIAVRPDSPFKTLKELVDAAKAKPDSIKVSTVGLLSNTHLDLLLFEQAVGVKFAPVHFAGGGAQANTALLGGHVDASCQSAANYASMFKSGQIRILGIMDKQESKFLPGVKTMQAQGFDIVSGNTISVAASAGTPEEVVTILSDTIKKIMQGDEIRKKHEELAFDPRFMDAAQYGAMWDESEAKVKPLVDLAKRQ